MKKAFLICMIAVMILFGSAQSAYAFTPDCREIDCEQLSIPGTDGSVKLLRVYNGSFMDGFLSKDSLEELVSEKYVSNELFISYDPKKSAPLSCYIMNNGELNRVYDPGISDARENVSFSISDMDDIGDYELSLLETDDVILVAFATVIAIFVVVIILLLVSGRKKR
ncbi:MAG: hypothetical protein IJS71_09925 [Clostridia bacterium]|nr:hypothetical protein [Clostridia bacterium]